MEKIRILLVDDEDSFRRTVAKRLIRRGMDIRQASSGEECLEILDNDPIDVVVLDVKMPGMDGIETLRHIKKRRPMTEVIMLTGHATTRDGVDGIKTGAFDYLMKPIELEHLLNKIRQAHEKIVREEEKRKEAAFRAKMEEQMIATERLASLGTLAAGVAHEINNPLAIIRESAGWMRSILNNEEFTHMPRRADFEMALTKIEKGVERIKRITLQLLGSARQTDSAPSLVDMEEFVDETVSLLQKEAADRGLKIVKEVDPETVPIWIDPYKLRQVLINIMTNAIHATGPGGEVAVIVRQAEDRVTLTVRDNGSGIPKEHLNRIFEPFFSTKSPGEGTGLGLFVTRNIVKKLGGKIEVDSRLGEGTAFSVILPADPYGKDRPDKG